jgi:hypothetical protein
MRYLLFLLPFLFLCEISYCDIIPENSHKVNKNVRIINVDDFPEYCFIAYILYPTGEHIHTFKINSKMYLNKGYKFNNLNILAIKKNYLAKKNLDTTNWLKDKNVLKSNIKIESEGGFVSNVNPISSINEDYMIVGYTDTSFLLYKCKEMIRFANGQPAYIKTYKYRTGISQLDNFEYIENNLSMAGIYSSSYIFSFLKALLYTIIIETIVLLIIFKTRLKHLQIKNSILLLTGILISFSTLPYVWFVLPIFIKPTLLFMLISELSVIIIESIIIWKLLVINYRSAVSVSLICNLTSFLFGLLINLI